MVWKMLLGRPCVSQATATMVWDYYGVRLLWCKATMVWKMILGRPCVSQATATIVWGYYGVRLQWCETCY